MELILAARAFADSTRVRVLSVLRGGELCVCELCDALGVTQSTLSTHLQVIREAGLVTTRKHGKWIYYAIRPEAQPLLDFLFRFFSKTLKDDADMRKDQQQLAARLKERKGGACCVGFCRPSATTRKRSRDL